MKKSHTGKAGFLSLLPSAAVLSAGILWGIINLFVKTLSAAGFSALQISTVRMFVSAAASFAALLLFDRKALRVRIADLWMFVGTGIVSVELFNVCYFRTVIEGQASIAVVLLYTSPVFVLLLSALLFRERVTLRGVLALVLTFAGCVLTAGIGSGKAAALPPRVLATGLASGFFYAMYTIFGRIALRRYESKTVTAYTFLFAALGSAVIGQPAETLAAFHGDVRLCLFGIGIGIVCTVLPYFLYTWGLDRMASGKAAILAASEPLVGAVIGMTVFGEDSGAAKLCGIALILASILLLGTEKRQ